MNNNQYLNYLKDHLLKGLTCHFPLANCIKNESFPNVDGVIVLEETLPYLFSYYLYKLFNCSYILPSSSDGWFIQVAMNKMFSIPLTLTLGFIQATKQ